MTRGAGFSVVELLVAVAITLVVLAGVFTVVAPAHGAFAVQPEIADVQQRLRVAGLALAGEIRVAGAGPPAGTNADSALLQNVLAPILPYRLGPDSPDAAGTFRSDAITVISSAPTAVWTTLRQAIRSEVSTVGVDAVSGCPVSGGTRDAACGFAAGMNAIVTDDSGAFDLFAVTDVTSGMLVLRHMRGALTHTYPVGARIAAVRTPTYYLKDDPSTSTYQLARYNGVASDAPVVDHIVALAFEYFGDPSPFGSGAEVRLTPAELVDGPWLPDGANVNRYDADLRRVRRVVIRVRAQAASAALRGPAGLLFTHGGTARDARRRVPDVDASFDVSPPNLRPLS